jgi:hypothetical protein
MTNEELRSALSTPPPEDYLQSLEKRMRSSEDGKYLLMDKPILAPLDMTTDFSTFYVCTNAALLLLCCGVCVVVQMLGPIRHLPYFFFSLL